MLTYAAGAVLLLAVASCGPASRGAGGTPSVPPSASSHSVAATPGSTPPCVGSPASSVELGSPHRGGRYALFTTDGSTMYVTARRFEHGGPLDPPVGKAGIWVGPEAAPPRLNERTGEVDHTTQRLAVREGEYGELRLAAGRYWLWSSNGGDVLLIACSPGALRDPRRV